MTEHPTPWRANENGGGLLDADGNLISYAMLSRRALAAVNAEAQLRAAVRELAEALLSAWRHSMITAVGLDRHGLGAQAEILRAVAESWKPLAAKHLPAKEGE